MAQLGQTVAHPCREMAQGLPTERVLPTVGRLAIVQKLATVKKLAMVWGLPTAQEPPVARVLAQPCCRL